MNSNLDPRLLLAAAELAREYAYAPYSHFFVGAAVLASNGRMYAGANVENASYGLSVCAERTAILAAASAGERHINSLAVVSDAKQPSTPCGACLQVIQEFAAAPDIPILVATTDGQQQSFTLAELLPQPFALNQRG